MKGKARKITIAGIVYMVFFAGAGSNVTLVDRDSDKKCGGVERWDVKVLIDEKADDVKKRPKITTIEELNAFRTDTIEIKGKTKRHGFEMQVYKIKDCLITHAILESDNDIHLVIEDGKGHHMIAEIPDPRCSDARHSDFIDDFRDARRTFMKVKTAYNKSRFDVTGVFFIDKEHSSEPTGNADNNVELHPVLNLTKHN